MITFPKNNLIVGNVTLQVGCKMNGMSGDIHYHIGDRLQGELILSSSKDITLDRIEGELEFYLYGRDTTNTERIGTVPISQSVHLEAGREIRIPCNFYHPFDRINSLKRYPKSYWQFTATFYPTRPPDSSFLKIVLGVNDKFAAKAKQFQVPVINGKGNYRAEGRELRIKKFRGRQVIWLAALVFFPAYSILLPSFRIIHYAGLALLLIITAILLFRLTGFQETPMELIPQRDGKIRLRMLDRGNGSWKKARVGLRVVGSDVINNGKNTKIDRVALYNQEFSLSDLGHRQEHFIEATIPWPSVDLPISYFRSRQGYVWELFLKTPGSFGEQEQAWPVNVSWEAFQLPDESPANPAERPELEEVLDLRPLKEKVRLKNEELE